MEINEMNYEMYALDYAEQLLSGEELVAMEAFLDMHPELREEILAICGTMVPEDAVMHGDLESLKSKRKVISMWYIPLTSAAAAVIVVALGLWFFNQGPAYGELAADQPVFNIHYSIELTYRDGMESGKSQELRDTPFERSNERNSYEIIDSRNQLLANQTIPGVIDEDELRGTVVEQTSVEEQISEGVDSESEVPYRVKLKIVDPVEVPEDDYFVLPVTIELYELSRTGSENVYDEMDKLAAMEADKSNRRKMIKDGALSLLQQTFMPEGVNNLLSN